MSEATEEELIKIINSKKCKSVKINGKNYYISKNVKDEAKKKHSEGGFAFLAAIPWVIGALATSTGIASGIAGTVANSRDAINKKKQGELIELQKQEIIKKNTPTSEAKQSAQTSTTTATTPTTTTTTTGSGIKKKQKGKTIKAIKAERKGTGIYLNPYQGTAIHKYLKNIEPKFKSLTKKFKSGTHIIQHGKGIYLNPYKSGKGIKNQKPQGQHKGNKAETEDETETETEEETETETEDEQY